MFELCLSSIGILLIRFIVVYEIIIDCFCGIIMFFFVDFIVVNFFVGLDGMNWIRVFIFFCLILVNFKVSMFINDILILVEEFLLKCLVIF